MSSHLAADQPPVLNRWLVVVGAIMIQLALGAIYAWSVFTTALETQIADGGYGFTPAQTQGIFCAGLATFALVMLYAGKLQATIGPQKVAVAGGIVLGVGYILGGFLGGSFLAQLIFIGFIGGAGIGLAYVVPIAVGVKWFPDMKGVITGLAVAGFGFGAMIWVKLAGSWFGGLLNTTSVFGLPGVQSVFVIYGVIFAAFVLIGSLVMVNPPAGWKPAGWDPALAQTNSANSCSNVDFLPHQMRRTPQYWTLLFMFTASAMSGLMVIGCIQLFGTDSLLASGAVETTEAATQIAGTAMAALAILNGLGRILWGTLSEKLGRKTSLIVMCFAQGVIMLVFFNIGGTQAGLIFGACVIGFNFGGNFALFAAATADFFGNKHIGQNYPWVFLAYGVAGIVGPQIAAFFRAQADGEMGAWRLPFFIAAFACLAAGGLGMIALRAPKVVDVLEEEPQPA